MTSNQFTVEKKTGQPVRLSLTQRIRHLYLRCTAILTACVLLIISPLFIYQGAWLGAGISLVGVFSQVLLYFLVFRNPHKITTSSLVLEMSLQLFIWWSLALVSGAMTSPLIFWMVNIPFTAFLLFKRSPAFLWLLTTLLALSSLLIVSFFWASVHNLIGLQELPRSLTLYLAAAQGIYWGIIMLVRERFYHLEEKLDLVTSRDFQYENEQLKNEIRDLSNRNHQLIRLYDNLKKFEETNRQKTEVLTEAARILDYKNKEIKLARDQYIEQSKKLEEINEDLTNSIRYAKKIQEAIIPDKEEIAEHFTEAFVYYRPKDIVSGDFYWFEEKEIMGEKIKILIAADCTGHGVPGAFMTIIGNSLINQIVNEMKITRPDELLRELDHKITFMLSNRKGKAEIHDGMDMVALCIDEEKRLVHYAAAHNPLYYVRKQKLERIKGSRNPVGGSQHREKKFELHTVQAEPNDVFYIFTDGFQDQFGEKEERKYMTRRFRNFLLSINRLPMQLQEQKVASEFQAWKGNVPQTDDVLIIGFRMP